MASSLFAAITLMIGVAGTVVYALRLKRGQDTGKLMASVERLLEMSGLCERNQSQQNRDRAGKSDAFFRAPDPSQKRWSKSQTDRNQQ